MPPSSNFKLSIPTILAANGIEDDAQIHSLKLYPCFMGSL